MATRTRPQPVRRRKRAEEHEEHAGGEERWMVSYADMVTLLLVLFIVLFSMSEVDSKKYALLKDGLSSSFGHSQSILSGSSPLINDEGQTSNGSSVMEQNITPNSNDNISPVESEKIQRQVDQAQRQANERSYADAEAQVKSLLGLWQKMQKALAKKGLADDAQAAIDERGLVVSLVSRHVVFPANLADLTSRGQQVVDTIAPVLSDIKEPVEIDGHTNQVKVKPKYYEDDWGLSTARALTVLRRLNEVDGIPNSRLRASGFGHTKPLIDPATKGSQKLNKRVDIVVLSQAPAETRALYEQVQQDLEKSQNQTGAQQ